MPLCFGGELLELRQQFLLTLLQFGPPRCQLLMSDYGRTVSGPQRSQHAALAELGTELSFTLAGQLHGSPVLFELGFHSLQIGRIAGAGCRLRAADQAAKQRLVLSGKRAVRGF